eukprot:scaffold29941_cov81-Cyclotella_meneghiniana.AAC.1
MVHFQELTLNVNIKTWMLVKMRRKLKSHLAVNGRRTAGTRSSSIRTGGSVGKKMTSGSEDECLRIVAKEAFAH